ncbi:MAG: response regulator [Archangium sp.]|nr:response regulator [Archangium sp.]
MSTTRVLVAEPSAPISAALRKFLDGLAEVQFAHFLDEAVQLVRARPPDVVVAAVSSSFDGEALCAQIRRLGVPTGVVLVYPPEEEHAADRAWQHGADSLLVGPLKKAAVVAAVRTVLKVRELKTRIVQLEADVEQLKAAPTPPPPEPKPAAPPPPLAGLNVGDEAFFKKFMLVEVKRSKRYQYPLALMILGFDKLDSFLMSQPDPEARRAAIRAEVLPALGKLIRDIDVAVSFGEDKYLVFLPHTPRQGSVTVADRALKRLAQIATFPGGTASIGIASYDPKLTPTLQVSFGALVRDATAAMKMAQDAGGGRAEIAPLSGQTSKRSRISMG